MNTILNIFSTKRSPLPVSNSKKIFEFSIPVIVSKSGTSTITVGIAEAS